MNRFVRLVEQIRGRRCFLPRPLLTGLSPCLQAEDNIGAIEVVRRIDEGEKLTPEINPAKVCFGRSGRHALVRLPNGRILDEDAKLGQGSGHHCFRNRPKFP